MHMEALGIITTLDPPLNYHHKMIANHNECDCMDNVPLVWQKNHIFSIDGHTKGV